MFRSALFSVDQMYDDLWAETYAWEGNAPVPDGWSSHDPDEVVGLLKRARDVEEQNPAMALALEVEAATHGSARAMEAVGWRFWSGAGVNVDKEKATEFYRRAVDGGHRTATIGYARLLFELGRHGDWEGPLLDAIKDDFVPASFWLAWLSYEKDRSARVRKEVSPLLRFAADRGHPMAGLTLDRWMARGYLGIHEIPRGWVSLVRWAYHSSAGETAEART